MELLIDVFGYLSIVVHGLTILAQSIALGGVLFLVLLALPLADRIGRDIAVSTARIAAWGAIALLAAEAATVALQAASVVGSIDLAWADTLGANFAIAGFMKMGIAALLALLLFARGASAPVVPLVLAAILELVAATMTTHAVARLSDRGPLLVAAWLHQAGAAIWIGGIPCFLMALARATDGKALRAVSARFSRMSMAGVAAILLSGAVMTALYVGEAEGFYGTAYGVMVGAKIGLFAMLLGLGAGNFLLTERLRANPNTSIVRMRRFAEVELGIGAAIFFAAASLTSVPPAVDLANDRVTLAEIAERNTPAWPRLASPDHSDLALPALQAKLDREATARAATPQAAFVPGAGELPPRNANDIAWSEYNHHWAGLIVSLVGLLALANRAGVGWAKHWPLAFLGLAIFLFFRSDPETWPMGDIGFLDSFRDVEVAQHRGYVLLIVVFAWFEWRVRAGGWTNRAASHVFPLLCAVGGVLLLTHSHAIANIKDQLLIELTHTPLALAGIVAGWARWLELRLDPKANAPSIRVAGWVWPVAILFCGLLLLGYREA